MASTPIDVWLVCGNGDGAIYGVYLVPVSVLNADKELKELITRYEDQNGDVIAHMCEEMGYDINEFLEPYAISRRSTGGYNYNSKKYRIVKIVQPTY